MKLKILNCNYHRNGSGPCNGFICVYFEDKQSAKEYKCGDQFAATFETNEAGTEIEIESIRVINLSDFDSKWRGDNYVSPLFKALKTYCEGKNLTEVSWNAAAFPNQYIN